MYKERHVRLFRNGRNQAVRIPREFEFDGEEAIMRKDGDCLILVPIRTGSLLATLRELGPLNEPFPDIDDFELPLDEPDTDS
ncbi:MAG: AbrB/MazE/SpoVT family DNA-binding domain-containing protein [Granulosicoccaceae bacterium]